MAYWLTYIRCDDCDRENCFQCRRVDRQLTLKVVEAEDAPQNTLNGPCESAQDVLHNMVRYFGIDAETDRIYFKVKPDDHV